MRKIEFIDLRGEVDFIQKRYSFYWVALRSMYLNTKCPCFDGIPNKKCSKCMGTGYLYVDKLVKAQNARTTPGLDFSTQIGKINTQTITWIIQHDKRPKTTDWILELDLDESTRIPRQPFVVKRSFAIQDAWPYRGKNGEIIYWYCLSEERNFVSIN